MTNETRDAPKCPICDGPIRSYPGRDTMRLWTISCKLSLTEAEERRIPIHSFQVYGSDEADAMNNLASLAAARQRVAAELSEPRSCGWTRRPTDPGMYLWRDRPSGTIGTMRWTEQHVACPDTEYFGPIPETGAVLARPAAPRKLTGDERQECLAEARAVFEDDEWTSRAIKALDAALARCEEILGR